MNLKSVSENFSDIRIVVEGKTYNCHKIILSSVSEFFERLLQTDCIETSSGIIKLEDVQSSAFDILYELIYSAGDETVLREKSTLLLLELLDCANKWFMPFLTDACQNSIIIRSPKMTENELVQVFEKALTLNIDPILTTVKNVTWQKNKEFTLNSYIFLSFIEPK